MAKTFISKVTASSSSSLSFTSGIDSTYDVYEFHFVNIHAQLDQFYNFGFQVNASGQSGFNESIVSTVFQAFFGESGAGGSLSYNVSFHQTSGTTYQLAGTQNGNDNDQSLSGILTLFEPSSTTYLKHFMWRNQTNNPSDFAYDNYVAGYFNTTSAIDEIDFKFSSGNIDDGTIKMYGVS